ncbi:hypothetical protein EDD41_2519 [Luteococcus japonicus]|uniref:Uncharacterized protein n=1 Tax=Luteococcus japonicus TaxID=33984 RepID=A0A3N1ZWZ2_9ACTN|nr:hypothetical protein [Luteococcus japonicus]ROR55258.1 hypothetical protein EDD41_2519 [Luteococcus japonicus]
MLRGNITTWMGRPDFPVLAHLHAPQGPVKGAVVLCPPLGREQVASYRTLRQLGDALARNGLLAVRFTWTGQSDSAPMDPSLNLLDNWRADLAAVVEQLRGAGVERVHLAGLRLGALLAAAQAAELDIASLLLWDAVPSGRHFLRYEQAMYASDGLSGDGSEDFHGLGYTLRKADGEELRALKLKGLTLPEVPTATIVRAGGASDPGAYPGNDGVWSSDEQIAMLETSSMTAAVPTRTVAAITSWYSSIAGEADQELHLEPRPVAEFHVPAPGQGRHAAMVRVRESVVELSTGLLGILTEPVDQEPDQSVLYVAASSEPLDGPSGLWAISAREVAALGGCGLRVDKHGTGELGGPLPTDPMPYMPAFVDDVATAARWLAAHTGTKPIGVGMCSSVYFEIVRPNGLLFSKVVGINLLAFDRNPADIPDEVAMATDPSHLDHTGEEGAAPGATRKQRLRAGLKTNMPQPLWRTLGRLGKAHAPDDFLREAALDTELVLAFSPEDFGALAAQRGEAAIAWARRTGAPFQAIVDPELDHALFGVRARRRSCQLIRDELLRSRRLRATLGS